MKLSHQFAKEFFVGRKSGEGRDVGQGDDLVVHDTGFDLEFVVGFGKFGEGFGGRDGIGTEENGGRTIKEGVESVGKLFGLFFKGETEKVVFGDDERRVGFFGLFTENVLFGNSKAGVFGKNDGF
ncbi:MAG: hypothetical protein UV06_C0002G0131 [Candidatus Collierbacteria bacterium GW2011_GWA2_42_17]|uniref:Uncharacterized protein n=1 Tax=Candidatus Collierbacteria bacterium GW2011_GWA2_42_17 TaxID=1618378 RepID=A0A0G0Z390_9BACT|nr:MAG: hypothetical protein UU94_C0008G0024 [Candidatus Collierbacteria bacterium GW2011_GWB2_42_12]KKS43229.1 MAG: hypothetical protein UV06_C0002G0131 [Candidatus Collierbacteria bacterium GW2011_GWA2_42_17]KKS64300.1 MAG: hypothetical protein UV32_C0018G0022 [Candidatus Collierbacteria bacterium GW2011_GWF2_42_51]